MAVDAATSALQSLRDPRSLTSTVGDAGVGLCAGDFDLRKKGMTKVDNRANSMRLALGTDNALPI